MTDLLTGLDTRHQLHLRLPDYAARANSAAPLSLLLLSIRDLELWRQRLTPLASDRLLSLAADVLKSYAPPDSYAVLWDGSRFGLLLPSCPLWQAEDLGDQLREALRTADLPAAFTAQSLRPDFCFGVASTPPCDINELCWRAEQRLQQAEGGVFAQMRLVVEQAAEQRLQQDYAAACVRLAEQFLLHGDPYLCRHGQMTAGFALQVGRKLGMSEAQLAELELSAAFADICMSEAAGAALNKPGCLTMSEVRRIHRHPEMAERLTQSLELPRGVSETVRFHHERLDGSGYPDGLRGSEIPLSASILSACGTYAAMLLPRPYRPARKPYRARAEMSAGVGSAWPRDVVREVVAL